jgi:hypothetical protein
MGYSVSLDGRFAIEPALLPEQVHSLTVFTRTGRTAAVGRPSQIAGATFMMQAHVEGDHEGLSARLEGQPSRFCCWRPTSDGRSLEWDGCEKFTRYEAWAKFLITTFFAPWERCLEGRVQWTGEDGATGVLVASGLTVVDEPDVLDSPLDEDVRAMLTALRGPDQDLRLIVTSELTVAIDASAELQRESVAALCQALVDPHLVKRALESLGELGDIAKQAVATVMPLLESPDPQVRYWATFAIARMGPGARVAVPILKKLTTDEEYGPRYGAIDALKRLEVE